MLIMFGEWKDDFKDIMNYKPLVYTAPNAFTLQMEFSVDTSIKTPKTRTTFASNQASYTIKLSAESVDSYGLV